MKLPKEGFRFNCGLDICTFPNQYCDNEDKRCAYCSEDVCRSGSIPEQCGAACSGDTLSTTTTYSPGLDPNVNSIASSDSPLPVYGAYVIAILALLLVLFLMFQRIWKGFKKLRKSRKNYTPMAMTTVKVVTDEARQTSEQQNIEQQTDFGDNTSQRSFHSAAVVTHPDEESSPTSHNFGDHSILPSNSELSVEESIPNIEGSGGFITQPQNNITCEIPDHNLLENDRECSRSAHNQSTDESEDCSSANKVKSAQKTHPYIGNRPDVQSCTGQFKSVPSNHNFTMMKERVDAKVC